MEQKHRLIDGFCEAIDVWSAATGIAAWSVISLVIFPRLGAGWSTEKDAALGIAPGTKREAMNSNLLHTYLIRLTERLNFWEDFLIIGLVHAVEYELSEAVGNYTRSGIDKNLEQARKYEELAFHPEKDPILFEGWRRTLKKHGMPSSDPYVRDAILQYVGVQRSVADWKSRPGQLLSNDEALKAWRELISPIISHENIREWQREYFEYLGQLPGSTEALEKAVREVFKEYESS
jgi:hypothetical protein